MSKNGLLSKNISVVCLVRVIQCPVQYEYFSGLFHMGIFGKRLLYLICPRIRVSYLI